MQAICKFLSVISLAITLGAPFRGAAQPAPIRQPLGIYAIPYIDGCVAESNHVDERIPNNILYLLGNPAISGIAAIVRSSNLNPASATNASVGSNNWSILDDIFKVVQQYNSTNAGNPASTVA